MDTLQGAINLAASEAEEEARDQTAVSAPLVRSEKAVGELERALSALPKARTLPDWDEPGFLGKIVKLKKLLEALETSS